MNAEDGIKRSLAIYYGDPEREAAMDALYARFVKPGDLVFDVGAHVGDRIASFRRLGAKVVAVEANPDLVATLLELFSSDEDVALVSAAIGSTEGSVDLKINTANPTVSTLSDGFIQSAQHAEGWEGQNWDRTVVVPQVPLDALIDEFGAPAFIKIDIEGYEAEALKGLSQAVPALSFEFTTIQRDVALACLTRLETLGYRRFNLALGESQSLAFEAPISVQYMARHIAGLPHDANSGDVYAMRD
jgi:FkbM family methyltransferase